MSQKTLTFRFYDSTVAANLADGKGEALSPSQSVALKQAAGGKSSTVTSLSREPCEPPRETTAQIRESNQPARCGVATGCSIIRKHGAYGAEMENGI